MLVVGDADVLVALADPRDEHHTRAMKIFQNLIKQKAEAIFPITAVCEAIRVLQCKPVVREGKKVVRPDEANFLVKKVQTGVFPLLPIDEEIVTKALKIYEEENFAYSKGNTPFDAIIAAIVKRSQETAVFSFDGVYKRMRLPLAENLFT